VRSAGSSPSDAQLHRIRIRAKQLRYTAETATPVLGKAARRIATDAEALQSVLGDHHDSVAAEQWLRQQALTGSRGTVFSAGILVARERRRQEELRDRWSAVWDHLDAEEARRSLG
jgi:CHAD domain-containing protein